MTQAKKQFSVDTSKGTHDGAVSSQWSSRPDDQKFLSLSALRDSVAARRAVSAEVVVPMAGIEVQGGTKNSFHVRAAGLDLQPTHYGFGLLCYQAGAPTQYLRSLPSDLAAQCLTHNIQATVKADDKASELKLYHGDRRLYSAMSPKFGRIYDEEVVKEVQKIAGNGTGDTRWKVPGMLDWAKSEYNPFVDITKDTTTLYASDHDIFLFLVDDTHPISVGKTRDGRDDNLFRGFYVWNSEMGGKSFGISTFMLRGVCQNRNLWGIEDKTTLTIRHTKAAPQTFVNEVNKALVEYSGASARPIVERVKAAKRTVLARTDEERIEFLTRSVGLSRPQALKAIQCSLAEEGSLPETAWDFTQGITALARGMQQADDRVTLERKGAAIMEKVAVG